MKRWLFSFGAILAANAFLTSSATSQNVNQDVSNGSLMRAGVGEWCYDPVGQLSTTTKQDFVSEIIDQARRAQARYGVPGAVLAAMAIQESGYGRTRLAILSNNLLSFKKPANEAWRFGRPDFVLWCQPAWDKGNVYLHFGSKSAAFDYVAKVLTERSDLPYAKATSDYKAAISAGADRKAAGNEWLKLVAAKYTEDKSYVARVSSFAANPLEPGKLAPAGTSLWELVP